MMEPYPTNDAEIRECIECGAHYDLSKQDYYGPKCPVCTIER